MTEVNIPDEVREKIDKKFGDYSIWAMLTNAAEFGYGLSSELLAEKDKEIARMKLLFKTLFFANWGDYLHEEAERRWKEFQIKHNL